MSDDDDQVVPGGGNGGSVSSVGSTSDDEEISVPIHVPSSQGQINNGSDHRASTDDESVQSTAVSRPIILGLSAGAPQGEPEPSVSEQDRQAEIDRALDVLKKEEEDKKEEEEDKKKEEEDKEEEEEGDDDKKNEDDGN